MNVQHVAAILSDVRRKLVGDALQVWKGQLVDLSARNTLLYYRDLKVGTLDLGDADRATRDAFLDGRTVALSRLCASDATAARRARTIRNKARELAEERGIQSCFLVSGMATWTNTRGTAKPAAPLLLRPVDIVARNATEDDFDLAVTGDAEINPTFVHLMRTEFGVDLDADSLAGIVEDGADLDALFRQLRAAAPDVPGFNVSVRHILGTFSYAKLPMVSDLSTAEDALLSHEIVAAIAGDQDAQQQVRSGGAAADSLSPDTVPPGDEYLILDADSSQNYAVNAVVAGQNLVVEGPPGTGKSQTIANLISTLVARGKRVLFVAEKQVAITAVTDRLAANGLGGIVLDVHDGTISRARILAELKGALDAASRAPRPDLSALHQRVVGRRGRLSAHAAALHRRHEPWDVSLYDAQNALLDLHQRYGGAADTRVRLTGGTLRALDASAAHRVCDDLHEYVLIGGLGLNADRSPWADAQIVSAEQAQHALDTVGRIIGHTLPETRSLLDRVLAETGLAGPTTVAGWRHAFELLDELAAVQSVLSPTALSGPLAESVAATASGRWRRSQPQWPGATAGFWQRRRTRKLAATWWVGADRPSRKGLYAALGAAHTLVERWRQVSVTGGTPTPSATGQRAGSAYAQLGAELRALAAYLNGVQLDQLAADDLNQHLGRLADDENTLRKLPRLRALMATMGRFGLDPLLADLRARMVDPDTAVAIFQHCWYMSIRAHIGFTDDHVGGFDGSVHHRAAIEYRDIDKEHLRTTGARIRRALAEHIVATRDAYPQESQLVEHQAKLKRRHLPVRQLFQAAPHVLTALKPCWAMSPLVVSQLLPADQQYFDVVVFDEASQVRPADAIPAILRAKQIVVAGDRQQLPPTDFFTSRDDNDDSALGLAADGALDLSMTSGYESILDVLSALLRCCTLRWHYRSHDERLIGFSNAWIYDRSLITFPGVAGADCLHHVAVEQRPGAVGQEDSVTAEVHAVVTLMLDHAQHRSHESLGVITMGMKHADRIDTELRRSLTERPDLQEYFSRTGPDRPFVKNLERVQGDERDAIILSIGYGKDAAGRLPYRFGPLLLEGGQRRLNVAVTRARRRMTLVSSFTSADMDPNRSRAEGVKLLRAYLQYAESGGTHLGDVATEKPALNPFERDVRDRLTSAGIPLTAQYGVAGYHLDFAAAHPTRPGQMVLAIEADGATYHSSPTARDRDRLRQEQLERLGWTFHRIWSTDWFTNPTREIERAIDAYQQAVAAADTTAETPAATPTPVAPSNPADTPAPVRRTAPPLQPGLPITEYSRRQLVELIHWIESDTLLRTEEQLLAEVVNVLGYKRRGSRIVAAVAEAIQHARR